MDFGGRGHGTIRQEGVSEDDTSSSNDAQSAPPNSTYDHTLAGPSSHVLQYQESGLHNPTLPTYSQDPTVPRAGTVTPHQLPDCPSTYFQAWANVTNPRTAVDMTQQYPQFAQEDVSVRLTVSTSPFYMPTNTQCGPTPTQPPGHYPPGAHHRRSSLRQYHSPSPGQPTSYMYLPSPARSDTSYSPSETGSVHTDQPSFHFPIPQPSYHISNRRFSIRPLSNDGQHHQIYAPLPFSGSTSTQAPDPYAQVPTHLGSAPPGIPQYPINDFSQFLEPQFPPPQSAQEERKRKHRGTPYPQTNRQKRTMALRHEEEPVASSSRVTLDAPSPLSPIESPLRAARARGGKARRELKNPKEAERKRFERTRWRDLVDCLGRVLGAGEKSHERKVLDRIIERLEGEPVSDCNSPIGDRDYPDKSLKNSISAKNRNKRMERIREKLYGRGYEIPKNKGREFVLQIVLYELGSTLNGVIDRKLAKFLDPEFINLISKYRRQN